MLKGSTIFLENWFSKNWPGDRPRIPNLNRHSPTLPPKHWTHWLFESDTKIIPEGFRSCIIKVDNQHYIYTLDNFFQANVRNI